MRILLFGGGFDPPHAGHAALAAAAIRTLEPDRTLLVPSWLSPTKRAHGAPAADRLAMTRALARRLPKTAVEPFEQRRRRRTYTYELLRHVAARHPGAELCFLVGSDSAAQLGAWKRPDALKRLARWIVGRRPGASDAVPPGFRTTVLPGRFPPISSRDVRARIRAGEDWKGLVSGTVAAHIARRRLYGLSIQDELQRSLSPERYAHSLAVARLARRLAEIHGEDPDRAALAGLLHDAGRRFDLRGMAEYARRRRLPVPRRALTLERSPLLAHAYIGADLARRRFGVDDPAVLDAIAQHTLGRAGMARLERLLYVADLAAEGRGFPAAARVRRLALRDLDVAFRRAVSEKMRHVRSQGLWMHPLGPAVERWSRTLR